MAILSGVCPSSVLDKNALKQGIVLDVLGTYYLLIIIINNIYIVLAAGTVGTSRAEKKARVSGRYLGHLGQTLFFRHFKQDSTPDITQDNPRQHQTGVFSCVAIILLSFLTFWRR